MMESNEKCLVIQNQETENNSDQQVPLNTSWTLWLDKAERGISAAEYEASIQKIYSFNTVQGFWSVFNNIPNVQELQKKYSYHLMRQDRKPLWEDELNRKGGSWHFKVNKHDSAKVFKEFLLAAIGEQFSEFVTQGDEITGVSVTVREKDDIVLIWNSNSHGNTSLLFEKVHQLVPGVKFIAEFYRPHYTHRSYEGGKVQH